jgi:hypothetical protein
MAQHDTFLLVPIGKQFTVAGWHANEDGTALILTKVSETTATDSTGRVWNFSASQGLQCFER